MHGAWLGRHPRRQMNDEGRTLPRCAFHRQAAAVAVDDMLDDGQAQPRAGALAALLAGRAIEALGQPWQLVPLDAGPLVADPDDDVALLGSMRRDGQGHPGAVRIELAQNLALGP